VVESRQPTEELRKREDEIFNEWKLVAEHGGGESVAAREMAVALAGAEALVEAQNAELLAQRDVVAAARAATESTVGVDANEGLRRVQTLVAALAKLDGVAAVVSGTPE